MFNINIRYTQCNIHASLKLLTQTTVRHHNVCVTVALLSAVLAPVLDANRLVSFYNIYNLQLWVHLEKGFRKSD